MSNFVQLKEISLNGEIITLSNERGNDSNYYSIIVGPNGSGKSRILRNITVSFVLANKLHYAESLQKLPSDNSVCNFLDININLGCSDTEFYSMYSAFEKDCTFALSHSKWSGKTEFLNIKCSNSIKVICLSNTVFNKFPKNIKAPFQNIKAPYSIDCYENLSLSEDMYILSNDENDITDVLSKRVIDLFFSPGLEREQTLYFLDLFGIKGDISISLEFNRTFNPYSGDDVADIEELTKRVASYSYHTDRENAAYMRGLTDVVSETSSILSENIKRKIEREHGRGRYTVEGYIGQNREIYKFNLSDKPEYDMAFFINIKRLSDNNIIKLKSMSFMRHDRKINLYDLSSGELSVLLLLIKLHGSIESNSLILIDEPEISMHPAWQRNVIPAIERCFPQFTGCHFIIATHSPQVVSSIPKENSSVIILGETTQTIPGYIVRGKSADYQLFASLDSPGERNEYAIRMLTTIIAKLNLKKELSNNELIFLDKAIDSFPLESEANENEIVVVRLLKQAIGMYRA